MKSLFVIFLMLILADRVAPESRENLALFPLTTHEKQSKGEIAMLTEEWKPINNYETLYEISNYGRIKSLERTVRHRDSNRTVRERILKPSIGNLRYYMVCLCKEGKPQHRSVHTLVWDAFGDKPRNCLKSQIDHIDNNKLNNHIENLQLLTPRENNSKKFKQMGRVLPTGVCYHQGRYQSQIRHNGESIFLGYYDNIEEASLAYQNKLKEILEAENDI